MHVCDWQIAVVLVIIANGGRLPYAASFFKKNLNVTVLRARFDWDSSALRCRHHVECEAAVIPVICCSKSLFNMKVDTVLPATLAPFEMQLFKPVSRFSYHHLLAAVLPVALRCS